MKTLVTTVFADFFNQNKNHIFRPIPTETEPSHESKLRTPSHHYQQVLLFIPIKLALATAHQRPRQLVNALPIPARYPTE